jgi:hypothetical protein
MKFLLVEPGNEVVHGMKEFYRSNTSGDVDIYSVSDLNTRQISDKYDVVLSRFFLGDGRMGPDILDQFEADTKALYSGWREEKRENSVISRDLQKYPVVPEPGGKDLEEFVNEYLE